MLPSNTSTSSFIELHQADKINWSLWSKETIKHIQKSNKPVFLYIGTTSSAWSIAMVKENFKNDEIVEQLNTNFIPVLVDREQHPELEFIYGNAVQSMTGKSGRPLTVFLTPKLKPFFGGTYFPVDSFETLPSLVTILNNIASVWQQKAADFYDSSDQITLKLANTLKLTEELPTKDEEDQFDFENSWVTFLYHDAFKLLQKQSPKDLVGFGEGPRFPFPEKLSFLLRYFVSEESSEALSMVVASLDRIAKSAITDQLAGGFHRYTLDPQWEHPNPEKSLVDNAALIQVFIDAFQITGSELYENTIANAISFIIDNMRDAETNLFYSSISSTSMERPTEIYHWTHEDLKQILEDDELDIACRYFSIIHDKLNYLTMPENLDDICKEFKLSESEIEQTIVKVKQKMMQKRLERKQPIIDNKSITSENSLIIETILNAAMALNEPSFLTAAMQATEALLENLIVDGKLYRSFFEGKAAIEANLEDYANLSNMLITLYEATFELSYLEKAMELTATMSEIFYCERKTNFIYERPENQGFVEYTPFFDNSIPSALSSAYRAIMRIDNITNDKRYAKIKHAVTTTMKPTLFIVPTAALYLLNALYQDRRENLFIGVGGEDLADENLTDMLNIMHDNFIPAKSVVHLTDKLKELCPKLKFKEQATPAIFFGTAGAYDEGVDNLELLNYIFCSYMDNR